MPSKREMPFLRLFLSFIIATFIFIAVFILANSVSYLNYRGIYSQNDLIETYLHEFDNISNFSQCDSHLLFDASEKLDSAGYRINLLETRLGKNNEGVLILKKSYSDLELRHLGIVKKLNELCSSNYTTIIFFYSNKEDKKKESEMVGYILSSLKKEHLEKVMIYSFDYDLDYSAINLLKSQYNITSVPVNLINEKELLYVKNIRDFEGKI